jgi:hypothetical protein
VQSEDLQFRVEARMARLAGRRPPFPLLHRASPCSPPRPPRGRNWLPAPAHPGRPRRASSPAEEIGRGLPGVVLRAEDRMDGRSVALRRLPAGAAPAGMQQGVLADLKAAWCRTNSSSCSASSSRRPALRGDRYVHSPRR